ncbi:MAG: hypothetical protein A2X25_01595 [Chloroflexi bacterium GWB2_49_20]|nr:MAG: hypothetical protein A2X25_01595 [Chloroflexi bacterium GWB2_49_20]OGN78145.1 MAG: hypothetical protein A2X26_14200 [Chloroflexi bacterium GWC2_49_37]OGN85181.1 MAG: hypothetical protein A2X27_06855 [Chloroflexi bacterium GWD2_49_16]
MLKNNLPFHASHLNNFQRGFSIKLLLVLTLSILYTGCGSPKVLQLDTSASITVDGTTQQTNLPAGSTVQEVLISLGINLGSLDRVEPPLYTLLTDGISINVIRVREEFKTEQVVIPFIHQELRSESISQEETRLVQPGVNGLKELTYRTVFEDDFETMSTVVKDTIIQPAVPEIVMTGVQAPFAPLSIPGKLAYLSAGNAWIMDGSTAIRRPLVTTADLDGRIFALSPKADWLLFTRKSTKIANQEINTLWVVSTEKDSPVPFNLKVSNIVHFAAWIPGSPGMIAYSTVEPRDTSPKWQANNDLYTLAFSSSGWTSKPKVIVEANSGGTYGWWGTSFAWSPDGQYIAYSRPDEIGLIDLEEGLLAPITNITPLQTHRDWAWIPGITWCADSNSLYITTHAPSASLVSAEESPLFDLAAISMVNSTNVQLVQQTGMFTYPSCSPELNISNGNNFKVAFLQAIFPDQSETSRYHLVIMDRDGSNRQTIFPPEGLTGIEPQIPVWAPGSSSTNSGYLAILYQGNIWLLDTLSDFSQQITGDGLIERVDWK